MGTTAVSGQGMQAAVLVAPGQVAVQRAARPKPGPGEVLLRLEGSGVCGSSMPVWGGRSWFDYPQPSGAPGHEGWGRVVALGSDVTGVSIGERVTCLSYRAHAEYDVAQADHLDILGHYGEAPDHVSWLKSGSGYRGAQYEAQWRRVIDFLVR